jgi:2-polyprenyl-3-methyl-5-hydroxy-6-metoxy-1,4-benzoquinol methylase
VDFYESISAYYDRIFPTDPQAVSFLDGKTGPVSRVLDIACGTGGYSIALAERGHRVTGVDLDQAMIRAARSKARDPDQAPEFRALDMLAMTGVLEPGFDLAFCIGNSLVHLETDEQILRLLADCHLLLRPGGVLVLQIINYDRILSEGLTGLPALRDDDLEFLRHYDLDASGREVIFRTELRVGRHENKRVIQNQIPLRIVTAAQLTRLVREAGFRNLGLSGGFDGRPLGPESLPLVLSAARD